MKLVRGVFDHLVTIHVLVVEQDEHVADQDHENRRVKGITANVTNLLIKVDVHGHFLRVERMNLDFRIVVEAEHHQLAGGLDDVHVLLPCLVIILA